MTLSLIQQALTLVFDFISCCGLALFVAAYLDVVSRRSRRFAPGTGSIRVPQLAPAQEPRVVIKPVIQPQGLEAMTWRQLIEVARPLKVKRYKSLNKAQLIAAIRDAKSHPSSLVTALCHA